MIKLKEEIEEVRKNIEDMSLCSSVFFCLFATKVFLLIVFLIFFNLTQAHPINSFLFMYFLNLIFVFLAKIFYWENLQGVSILKLDIIFFKSFFLKKKKKRMIEKYLNLLKKLPLDEEINELKKQIDEKNKENTDLHWIHIGRWREIHYKDKRKMLIKLIDEKEKINKIRIDNN